MGDPEILAIKKKIRLVGSEELMQARPARQAIVEIETTGGRRLSHRTVAVRGTADNPMDRREVEAKARDLIAEVMGKRRANDIIRAVGSIETVTDIAALQKLWRPAGVAAAPQPAGSHL
jgi:2-methylcitrate dehydratase PrpD